MSVYAQWNPALATGDLDVDAQHVSLFALVNKMHTLIEEGRGHEAVDNAVEELVAYVHTHFEFEEMLMRRVGYPALDEQISQHRDFAEQVDNLRAEMVGGELVSPSGLLDFARAWLVTHIDVEDRKVGDYIRSLSA